MYQKIYEEFKISLEDQKIVVDACVQQQNENNKKYKIRLTWDFSELLLSIPVFSNVKRFDCGQIGCIFVDDKWPKSKLKIICDNIYFTHIQSLRVQNTIHNHIIKYYEYAFIPTEVLNNHDIKRVIMEYLVLLFQKECLEIGIHYSEIINIEPQPPNCQINFGGEIGVYRSKEEWAGLYP